MGCIYAVLAIGGPRLVLIAFFLFEPARFEAAFQSWLWPILGFLFLPLTTVAYVLVAPSGVTGYDWVWLIGAFVADLGLQGSSAYGNRQRVGMG
jgi:hypothetical protein